MHLSRFLSRSAIVAALAFGSAGAQAALYQATLTGTLAYGADDLWLFTGGILPKNTPWSMTFTFDDAVPATVFSDVDGSSLKTTAGGIIDATFT